MLYKKHSPRDWKIILFMKFLFRANKKSGRAVIAISVKTIYVALSQWCWMKTYFSGVVHQILRQSPFHKK